MLTRAPRSAYICLRCRRTLSTDPIRSLECTDPASKVSRRWASAAVSHREVDEADDHDAHRVGPPNEASRSPQQNLAPRTPADLTYRRWQPKPTAKLGVNSLGKPAEVLILPSRDRRIPKVPKEDGNESWSRTTLQEAIDSETASLSLNELAENIEQVRSHAGKLRGQLEAQEWATLKKHLMSGFKHDQLKKYILLRRPEDRSTGLPFFVRENKLAAVRYLVEEVWGFTVPQQDDSSRQQTTRKKVKLSLGLREAKINYLLMWSSQFLRAIAEDLNVLLEVSASDRRIRVSGYGEDVQEALNRISRAAKELSTKIISLKREFGSTFEDPTMKNHLKTLLKSVQQKYQNSAITLGQGSISIIAPRGSPTAEQAQRDILLAVPAESETHSWAIWPPKGIAATVLQPSSPPPEFPAALQWFPWYRRVSSSPSSRHSTSQTQKSGSFYSILEDRIERVIDPTTAIPSPEQRGGLFYELSASLGQVLCRDLPIATGEAVAMKEAKMVSDATVVTEKSQTDASLSTGALQIAESPSSRLLPTRGNARFIGGAPFSTQYFAPMEQWNQQPNSKSTDVDEHARTIMRLELSPMSTSQSRSAPTFEIFLTSGESTEGKRAPLYIARASAIHREKQFHVLCPQGHVDVQFTQQLKQDLFYPKSQRLESLKSVYRALRSYVDRAQRPKSPEWVFQPFVSLPIHYTLWGVSGRVQRAAKSGKVYTKQREKQADVLEEKVQYILRTVDVVDVDSRSISASQSSTGGRFCLDHVTLTGTDATRQELRLAQRSLIASPILTPPKLSTFVKMALKVAEELGEDPTKTGQKPLSQ